MLKRFGCGFGLLLLSSRRFRRKGRAAGAAADGRRPLTPAMKEYLIRGIEMAERRRPKRSSSSSTPEASVSLMDRDGPGDTRQRRACDRSYVGSAGRWPVSPASTVMHLAAHAGRHGP